MFRFSYNSEFANTSYSGPIFFSFSLANTTITGCETAACLSKVSLVPYPPSIYCIAYLNLLIRLWHSSVFLLVVFIQFHNQLRGHFCDPDPVLCHPHCTNLPSPFGLSARCAVQGQWLHQKIRWIPTSAALTFSFTTLAKSKILRTRCWTSQLTIPSSATASFYLQTMSDHHKNAPQPT